MAKLEAKKSVLYNFRGAMSAVATPFDANGHLDATQIAPYARYLAKIGVRGVYIIGTTGEGYSLTHQEKLTLIKAWRSAIDALPAEQKLVAVVNVSSTIVSEALQLAKEVERLNFDGIALLPPVYYQADSAEKLVQYLKMMVNGGASETPFLYYHIPSFVGEFKFEIETFLELALAEIPQFTALKFTDANLIRFASVQARFGSRLNFFAGFEETLLATISLGAHAAIGATFSFNRSVAYYHELVDAFDRGNLTEARDKQHEIAKLCADLRKEGNFFATLKKELNREYGSDGITFGKPRAPIWID